jgi:hypothetical protein
MESAEFGMENKKGRDFHNVLSLAHHNGVEKIQCIPLPL